MRPLAWTMLLVCVWSVLGRASWADEIEIHGQVRVRLETFDRSFQGRTAEIDVFQRTRVGLKAMVSPEVQAFVQMQDSRVFGAEGGTIANARNLDLHQAYAQLEKSWEGTRFRVRAGRQELSYGNERIIGTVGWSNIGRSFDGAQFRLSHGAWKLDLVAARLSDGSTANPSSDDDLFLSYNQYKAANFDLTAEAYAMYRDDASGFFETTLGEHISGSQGRVGFDQEFAYQRGRQAGEDLSAFLVSAQAHVRIADSGRPTLGVGIDVLSGDDPTNAEVQLFDVERIFHTGHKFYGLMDVAPVAAGRAGLIDPYVFLGFHGPHDLKTRITLHRFYVHEEGQITLPASTLPETETNLGTEIDATLSVAVAAQAALEIGGALFFPGKVLENQGRDKNATWGYMQGIVSF